jgi:general stress protein 26
MLTTAEEDGSLRARPMAYKHCDTDSKNELWLVELTFCNKILKILLF